MKAMDAANQQEKKPSNKWGEERRQLSSLFFEEIHLLVAKRVKNSRRNNERSKTTMLSWRFEECSWTFGSQGTNEKYLCTTFSVQGITKINKNNGVISNHSGLQINHMHCSNYFGTVFSPFVPTQKQLLKSRRSMSKRIKHFSTHFSTLLSVLKLNNHSCKYYGALP